jgi:hypothetical protein
MAVTSPKIYKVLGMQNLYFRVYSFLCMEQYVTQQMKLSKRKWDSWIETSGAWITQMLSENLSEDSEDSSLTLSCNIGPGKCGWDQALWAWCAHSASRRLINTEEQNRPGLKHWQKQSNKCLVESICPDVFFFQGIHFGTFRRKSLGNNFLRKCRHSQWPWEAQLQPIAIAGRTRCWKRKSAMQSYFWPK